MQVSVFTYIDRKGLILSGIYFLDFPKLITSSSQGMNYLGSMKKDAENIIEQKN